ncbi:Protein of unknown function (DUF1573) [Galbibacter orientalis DSM 19592]|uniref:DUF1573 domain-containing protein n=1 Tax=Galbibacter orientalis DSM 19592 TaxID=926559 RepID=I3C6B7_9FLAO|nr:DUF1573 domain-containing protein [Galbibacter orientalis]EIJ39160.1 Protein of unknown function (DUF1573) [Galbibacter orientalis DSM 19592]|tara:strand:- start:91 stop:558 length:468 start_codon:yes stop_codon:yes gene_type:complete
MKKVFLILTIAAAVSFTSCKDNATNKVNSDNVAKAEQRDEAAKKMPVMTFEETEFDFGNIPQGQTVEKVFKFKNTGDAPLVVTDAKSSCGCTIPQKPEAPVAPGETGEILVKYNGSGRNAVTKTVTITANTEKGTEQLRIKAFVEAKDAAALPKA